MIIDEPNEKTKALAQAMMDALIARSSDQAEVEMKLLENLKERGIIGDVHSCGVEPGCVEHNCIDVFMEVEEDKFAWVRVDLDGSAFSIY